MRFAIACSSNSEHFSNFLASLENANLLKRIVLVINPAGRLDLLMLAQSRGIPAFPLVCHNNSINERSEEFHSAVLNAKVNCLLLLRYLLPLRLPKEKQYHAINIHGSLLPRYAGIGMYGSRIHEAVISDKVAVSGCTLHHLTEAYDEGLIIEQHALNICPHWTAIDLEKKIDALEINVLNNFIKNMTLKEKTE